MTSFAPLAVIFLCCVNDEKTLLLSFAGKAQGFLWLELSSQVKQRIEEYLKGRLPAEAFVWTKVEFGNEGCVTAQRRQQIEMQGDGTFVSLIKWLDKCGETWYPLYKIMRAGSLPAYGVIGMKGMGMPTWTT